jgi:2-dehydro-3-deoxyphosphooctonate aldolase (KDO 8-P synthase)
MPTGKKEIRIGKKVKIGGDNPFFLIAGPCVIESEEHTIFIAKEVKKICENLTIPFIFKASFDKANRSSIESYRGPGFERGLEILGLVKKEIKVPVLSDIHETVQIKEAAEVLDVIQIPAFLCRQTDLVVGAAKTQKPLNIKKGQFLSPSEIQNIIQKAVTQGNENLILTERGTSFGYNDLVFDVRSIPIIKEWGYPVVIDASHSVQKPGGEGNYSGGDSKFIPFIAKAGVSVGADGLFIEVHENPEKAFSDGLNSFKLNKLHDLLCLILKLKKTVNMNNLNY